MTTEIRHVEIRKFTKYATQALGIGILSDDWSAGIEILGDTVRGITFRREAEGAPTFRAHVTDWKGEWKVERASIECRGAMRPVRADTSREAVVGPGALAEILRDIYRDEVDGDWTCSECGGEIRPGDSVIHGDDRQAHDGCVRRKAYDAYREGHDIVEVENGQE